MKYRRIVFTGNVIRFWPHIPNRTNQIGNIGAIVTCVVTAVFFTMLLVTANTMGQSVRERTNELAVLKAIGFTNTGGCM
mgnify:CR=1 FL=1